MWNKCVPCLEYYFHSDLQILELIPSHFVISVAEILVILCYQMKVLTVFYVLLNKVTGQQHDLLIV